MFLKLLEVFLLLCELLLELEELLLLSHLDGVVLAGLLALGECVTVGVEIDALASPRTIVAGMPEWGTVWWYVTLQVLGLRYLPRP